jgi:NACalpha-BTF3-like transcription factor
MPVTSDRTVRRRRVLPNGEYEELVSSDDDEDYDSDMTPNIQDDIQVVVSNTENARDNANNGDNPNVARAVPPVAQPTETYGERQQRLRRIRNRRRRRAAMSGLRTRIVVLRRVEDIEYYYVEHLGLPVTRADQIRIPATDFPYNLRPTRVLRSSDPNVPHIRVHNHSNTRQAENRQVQDSQVPTAVENTDSEDSEDYLIDSDIDEDDIDLLSYLADDYDPVETGVIEDVDIPSNMTNAPVIIDSVGNNAESKHDHKCEDDTTK